MDIQGMLTKYNDMSLFQFYLTTYDIDGNYEIENAMPSFASAMNIKVDYDLLRKTSDSKSKKGLDKICVFYNESDERQFIFFNCAHICSLNSVTVRCLSSNKEKVMASFEPWRTETMEFEMGQSYSPPIDWYNCEPVYATSPITGETIIVDPIIRIFQVNGLLE